MADSPLQYELDGKVAVLTMDDGRANAVSPVMIQAFNEALDRAEKEAHGVLIVGREGRFSAGFDLSVMSSGVEHVRALVGDGGRLLMRLYLHPQPVVAACTGHALAAGALMLLASDTRIGAKGDFKLGLNEVAISMVLPIFGVELARERLSKRHFARAVGQAEIYGPEDAVDAGYLDQAVDAGDLIATAKAEAARLAELPTGALAGTKRNMRGAVVEAVLAGLDADMETISGPSN